MVVQGVALPKVSGSTRDQENSIVPAVAAAPTADAGRRFSFTPVVVTVLVAAQVAWFALLGYVALEFVL